MTDAILTVVDLAVLVAYLVAIPLAVLKGRPVLGLVGLVLFGSGAAISFAVFRQVREGAVEEWVWWLFALHGVAVAGLLVWAATRPALPGSRWDRRGERDEPGLPE